MNEKREPHSLVAGRLGRPTSPRPKRLALKAQMANHAVNRRNAGAALWHPPLTELYLGANTPVMLEEFGDIYSVTPTGHLTARVSNPRWTGYANQEGIHIR